MCNVAAVRQFCTCGNNEALLQLFFPTPPLLCCGQLPNSMTLRTYKVDDIMVFILTHPTIATPSDLGLSCLLPSLPCFLCYILISDHLEDHSPSHDLAYPFPLQVIVSYFILHCLLLLTYHHITYLLPSSHTLSPRVCPTHH
jgi:hypothetical protein